MSHAQDSVIPETTPASGASTSLQASSVVDLAEDVAQCNDHNILQKVIARGQGLRSGKGGCRERCRELGMDKYYLVRSKNMPVQAFMLYV